MTSNTTLRSDRELALSLLVAHGGVVTIDVVQGESRCGRRSWHLFEEFERLEEGVVTYHHGSMCGVAAARWSLTYDRENACALSL